MDDFEEEFKSLFDQALIIKQSSNVGPGLSQVLLEELQNFLPNKVWKEAIINEQKRDKNIAADINK